MKNTVKELIVYYERKKDGYRRILLSCIGCNEKEIGLRIKIYEQFIRDLENLEEM